MGPLGYVIQHNGCFSDLRGEFTQPKVNLFFSLCTRSAHSTLVSDLNYVMEQERLSLSDHSTTQVVAEGKACGFERVRASFVGLLLFAK